MLRRVGYAGERTTAPRFQGFRKYYYSAEFHTRARSTPPARAATATPTIPTPPPQPSTRGRHVAAADDDAEEEWQGGGWERRAAAGPGRSNFERAHPWSKDASPHFLTPLPQIAPPLFPSRLSNASLQQGASQNRPPLCSTHTHNTNRCRQQPPWPCCLSPRAIRPATRPTSR